MKKSLKKLCVLLLSLGTVLMLSLPALAAPGGEAVLNAKCVPGDTPSNANGLVFDLYKVADAASDGSGGFRYTLTEDFAASGVQLSDITAIVGAGQNSAEAHKALLGTLADYINGLENSAALRAGQSTAQRRTIGANRESTEAVAQFTGLDDGLYLVASQNAFTVGGTTYTPIPFLINLPYQMNGTSHTYVTAHVKFDVQTPDDPGPGPGTDPVTPSRPGGRPTTPPGPGTNPTTPPTTTVEDPAVPMAPEPVIEVLPDPVPMTGTPEVETPEVEIPEPRTPLAMLPQTGLLWWPVGVMAAAGAGCVAMGVYSKKRADRDA